MDDEKTVLAESKTAEAVNAIGIAEQARQQAHEASTSKVVEDTLAKFFAAQTENERFVSTQRIPFICTDINAIKNSLVEIAKSQRDAQEAARKALESFEDKIDMKYAPKEQFSLVQRIVYGAVTMILVAFFGAVIGFVIMRGG